MTYTRGAALALVVVSASLAPLSHADARCWRWHCGPPLIALPFIAAGAVVAGAATIATAPVRAVFAPYYAPPAYYGPPPGYYSYYRQPGYSYGAPAPTPDR
jgi:hypothetical protein